MLNVCACCDGVATNSPVGCAYASGLASVMPVPPAPVVPTAVIRRTSRLAPVPTMSVGPAFASLPSVAVNPLTLFTFMFVSPAAASAASVVFAG